MLKKILIETAYDSDISLEELSNNDIVAIEDFVQENRDILIGTIYESRNPFHFLPGHKAILLNLSKKIKEKHQNKKVKKVVVQNNNKENNIEEEEQKESKNQLISKLKHFSNSSGIFLELNLDDISDFFVNDDRFTCRITCPFCQKKISCIKKRYWAVSNFESHLKKHKTELSSKRPPNVSNNISDEINELLTVK